MNQTIAQWYEEKTGLNAKQGEQRIVKIEAFLKAQGVGLNAVEIYSRSVNSKYGYKPLATKPGRVKIGSTSPTTTKTTEYYVQLKK